MRAHIGDWLVLPPAPHEPHGRRGQVVGLVHPDGSPPYRVRWLDDDHVTVVFPPPYAHLRCPPPASQQPPPDARGAEKAR
ncbi:DUF1918 domain-containing protein [Pseudonocardia acidicola]|uniref:DUF1918 domain-containing protein n=1 Tax=Pseudonocardia acidicola TaxID=2724939 RepID=A0ABX1S7K7_9PSEU|nr:DUF1918 domain-containing protein [Pseudonocardia acidicola]